MGQFSMLIDNQGNPLKKHLQLGCGNVDFAVLYCWPDKPTLLKALGEQTGSLTIPPDFVRKIKVHPERVLVTRDAYRGSNGSSRNADICGHWPQYETSLSFTSNDYCHLHQSLMGAGIHEGSIWN